MNPPASRTWVLGLAGAAAAAGLFFVATSVHLERACVEMDTPYLPLCPDPPASPEAAREVLRERIARNPGDSTAWTRLLVSDSATAGEGVLRGASALAPHNHNVARRRAAQALERGQLAEGVALLVQIVSHRSSPESARVLAQVATSREGLALLRPHLPQARGWLPQVLAASAGLKMPPGDMLPLVAEALDALPPESQRNYMRQLKTGGQWLDAYGLWLALHKETVPLLYNGNFDRPLIADGFDWEFTPVPRSRAGVVVEQEATARRGLVLDLDFTGRAFTSPIVRQFVFAPPGTYRLRGEYMASKLRSEGGLAWAVVCTSARKALAGRSQPLRDTGGVWKPMELEFSIPADCGPVASLQLEPAAQYEAATGIKGRVAFDAFSLSRSTNSQ